MVPFFPGMAHSQLNKFRVPSGLEDGLAMNPKGWFFRQAFRSSAKRPAAIPDIFSPYVLCRLLNKFLSLTVIILKIKNNRIIFP